ncbi:MAG: 2-oxo acid dehydrogenase subunit E2, partial [Opitutaceae bacterium]|nr:2-oxo acid dehydrogenase subunit E2 [Opitutaceae bacterium]
MATIIEMPKLSDTMTAGTLITWLKKEGDPVSSGDMIAEIETDKATMELEVFEDGFLLKQLIAAGAQVAVGAPIAAIGEKGEKVEIPEAKAVAPAEKAPAKEDRETEAPIAAQEATIATPPAATTSTSSDSRIKISPLARKIAAEKGINPENIQGSGPNGRILKSDVLAAQKTGGAAMQSASGQTAVATTLSGSPIAEEASIPVSAMRSIIATRLLESKTTIPHFYLDIEVDAGPLITLRTNLNQRLSKEGGTKISITDFIIKAASEALRRVPAVNTSWAGDHIKQHSAVHMAIAVAVEDGLVTPKIENTHLKTLRQISSKVRDIAGRA